MTLNERSLLGGQTLGANQTLIATNSQPTHLTASGGVSTGLDRRKLIAADGISCKTLTMKIKDKFQFKFFLS